MIRTDTSILGKKVGISGVAVLKSDAVDMTGTVGPSSGITIRNGDDIYTELSKMVDTWLAAGYKAGISRLNPMAIFVWVEVPDPSGSGAVGGLFAEVLVNPQNGLCIMHMTECISLGIGSTGGGGVSPRPPPPGPTPGPAPVIGYMTKGKIVLPAGIRPSR